MVRVQGFMLFCICASISKLCPRKCEFYSDGDFYERNFSNSLPPQPPKASFEQASTSGRVIKSNDGSLNHAMLQERHCNRVVISWSPFIEHRRWKIFLRFALSRNALWDQFWLRLKRLEHKHEAINQNR
jgi:hypothetical protein